MPEQEQWLGAPVPDMREASFFLWPPECGRRFPFCAVQTNSVLSLCLGLVLPHHNPNEMRLINELLISFATTRRHIRHVLRPSSCVLRPSSSFSFGLGKQLLQWSRSAPWQLQHNIIMRWAWSEKEELEEVGGFFRLGAICCNPISSSNNVRVWACVCVPVLYYFSSTCLHTYTRAHTHTHSRARVQQLIIIKICRIFGLQLSCI